MLLMLLTTEILTFISFIIVQRSFKLAKLSLRLIKHNADFAVVINIDTVTVTIVIMEGLSSCFGSS